MAGTWLVETVLPYRQSNILLGPGRRSMIDDEQEIREKFHVLLICSGSNQSFAISARQFVLHDVFVLPDTPGCPEKFVSYRICVSYLSAVGRKIDMADKS